MWQKVDQLGWIVVDASISAALLLGVVTLAMLSCRQPARRLLLAKTALTAVLFLIPVTTLGWVPRCDVVGIARSAKLLAPFALPIPPPEAEIAGADGPITDAAILPIDNPFPRVRLVRSLFLLYALLVFLGLTRIILGALILWVMKQRAEEPSPASLALYDRLEYPSGHERPPLRVVGRIRRPVLAGLFQPIILIPPELEEPGASRELRLALLHELTHASRRDHWHGFTANFALVVWFFLPPIWWIWSRLRLDQEFVVDRIAADQFGKAGDYAAALVNMAASSSSFPRQGSELQAPAFKAKNPQPSPSATIDDQASPVYQRVAMLLNSPFPVETQPPRSWAWPTVVGVSLAALLAASVSVRSAQDDALLPRPKGNTFRMAKLNLKAVPSGTKGRVPLFELPVRLPNKFVLTVDVWGTPEALSNSRVAGVPLESDDSDCAKPFDSAAKWHKVLVKRDKKSIQLWIDGKRVRRCRRSIGTTAWLSVEPAPGLEASYQNLTLSW